MNKKIEWFQEVLSLEPGSKVFFPLAKLFVQTGDHEAAVQTLRKGLDRHPDFLEARFVLVDLLVRLGLNGEAREHIEHVTEPLAENPAFWKLWAQSLKETKPDLSVFLMLVASNLTGTEIRWTDVVMEGLYNLSERLVGEPEPDTPPAALDKPDRLLDADTGDDQAVLPQDSLLAGEAGPEPDAELDDDQAVPAAPAKRTGAIRTRTMADLLATQGDYAGAREIYAELLARAVAEEDKRVLSERVEAMQAKEEAAQADGEAGQAHGGDGQGGGKACTSPESGQGTAEDGGEDVFGKHAKNRLISTLEALAARFEARVRS